MRTTLYEPFSTIRRLQDEMNRAFGGGALEVGHSAVTPIRQPFPQLGGVRRRLCRIHPAGVETEGAGALDEGLLHAGA